MELNIVASPSPNGSNAAGKKPARFVKRGRFKAKREQQKAATAATGGLGNLRIKETPLVGPDPVVKKKEKGTAAAVAVPSSTSSSPLPVAGKKRKLAPVADSGESEKKKMTKVAVPPVASTTPAAPAAAAVTSVATTAASAEDGKKPKQTHQPKTMEPKPKSKESSSSFSLPPSKPKAKPTTTTNNNNNNNSPPQHPTRRDPAPVSVVKNDEYHMKPSQIDSTLPLPTKSTTTTTGSSSSSLSLITKGKSSKHIFTATPFSSLGLHDRLVSLLSTPKEHHGFGLKVATRVQSATLPALLSPTRPNALLCSETGSGKTLAYLLPLLQYLQALSPRPTRSEGTRAVIVAPTRELCHQIYEVLSRLVRAFIWVVPGIVVGGEKRKSEKARFRKGVMVLVGTPGRLLDHLQNTKSFGHEVVEWLVLDEVDRLVDLGFETQVREIVSRLRGGGGDGSYNNGGGGQQKEQRTLQVMAASATLSPAIDKFGRELLGRHVRIDAKKGTVVEVGGEGGGEKLVAGGGGEEEGAEGEEGKESSSAIAGSTSLEDERFTTPEQLVQQYMVVTCKLRLPALSCFLRVHASTHKTVVFFSTCDSVDFHHALFKAAHWPGASNENGKDKEDDNDEKKGGSSGNKSSDGFLGPTMPVYRLHGSIAQAERLQTFKTFSHATRGVLFCTDVAARGLDLPAVDWIVQYDPPTEAAEYVHRVGRTARRGRKGHALLFLLPSEQGYLDVLKKKGIAPTPLSLQQTLFQATPPRFRRFRAPEEVFCLEIQQRLETAVEKEQPQNKEEEGKGGKQGGGKMPAVTPSSLLMLGRRAFQSFVRAYATHPVELKMIFAVRSLHLGHVAKSFALREPPTSVKVGKEVRKVPGSGAAAAAAAAKPAAAAAGSSDGAAAASPADAKSTRKMMKQKQRNRDALSLDVRAQQAKRSSAGAKGGKSKNVFNSMSEFSSG